MDAAHAPGRNGGGGVEKDEESFGAGMDHLFAATLAGPSFSPGTIFQK